MCVATPGHNLQTENTLGAGSFSWLLKSVPLSLCQRHASSSQVKHFHGLGKSIFSVNDSLFSQKPLRGHFLDTHSRQTLSGVALVRRSSCGCGADKLPSQPAQTLVRLSIQTVELLEADSEPVPVRGWGGERLAN